MSVDPTSISRHHGRVAIVTGANSGLGFETTKAFAQLGITTVMACRNLDRGLDARSRIATEVEGAELSVMPLDLSDLDSVRDFAKAFRDAHSSLDLLILNAGIMTPPYATTADGFESQMGANHFGHVLLTSLLLDLMPDTPRSRVVSLSSNAHRLGQQRIMFDDLHWERKYSSGGAYAQSKLACLMFANTLQRRMTDAGLSITAVTAHPGISPTELSRNTSKALRAILMYTVAPFVTHPPAKAVLSQIHAALDEKVQGGEYYGPTGFRELKGPPGLVDQLPYALDENEQDRLWAVSTGLTGAVFPWERAAS